MRREERAQQIWSLLGLAASNRQILSYGIVAKLTGVPAPSVGDFLRPIQQFCIENNLPALTSIVVQEESGIPGEGFIAAEDVPAAQAEVSNIRGWKPADKMTQKFYKQFVQNELLRRFVTDVVQNLTT